MNKLNNDCILQIAYWCNVEMSSNLKEALGKRGDIINLRLHPVYILSKLPVNTDELLDAMQRYDVILGGERALQYFNNGYNATEYPWKFYCNDKHLDFKSFLEHNGFTFTISRSVYTIVHVSTNVPSIHIINNLQATNVENIIFDYDSIFQCYISTNHAVHFNWRMTKHQTILRFDISRSIEHIYYMSCRSCMVRTLMHSTLTDAEIQEVSGVTNALKCSEIPYSTDNIKLMVYTNMINFLLKLHTNQRNNRSVDMYSTYCYIYDYHHHDIDVISTYKINDVLPSEYSDYKPIVPYTFGQYTRLDDSYQTHTFYTSCLYRNRSSTDEDTLILQWNDENLGISSNTWKEICLKPHKSKPYVKFECTR